MEELFWLEESHQSPWFPIRSDERCQHAQRKSLIAAILIGALSYALFSIATQFFAFPSIGSGLAIFLAIVAYFLTQFFRLAKA